MDFPDFCLLNSYYLFSLNKILELAQFFLSFLLFNIFIFFYFQAGDETEDGEPVYLYEEELDNEETNTDKNDSIGDNVPNHNQQGKYNNNARENTNKQKFGCVMTYWLDRPVITNFFSEI